MFGRPGSDLLSQGLSHSTIGAEEFDGRVRNGIGYGLLATTTRPAKHRDYEANFFLQTLHVNVWILVFLLIPSPILELPRDGH